MRRWLRPAAFGRDFSIESLETGIIHQALEIAASLSLGLCLGFIYELFRVPRRLLPGAAFLLDTLFCLLLGAGLFVLGMACGGTLRFYMPFAAALGAGLYWVTIGRWLSPFWVYLESFGAKVLKKEKAFAKKVNKLLKNIFSFCKKRFRITKYIKNGRLGKGMSKSGARRARRKGENHEISQNGHTGKAYYPCPSDLRSFHDG